VSGFRIDLMARPGLARPMARKLRVEYAGAFYHVICRGNQRQVIFRSDADRKYYMERLEQYRQRYEFRIYAYVLMSNHVGSTSAGVGQKEVIDSTVQCRLKGIF
jgi:transposase IS200 family protein